MIIELPVFFAKKNKLLSNFALVVEVLRETPKSFEILLEPTCQTSSACWKCGKVVSNSKSVFWGLGPDCASTMGIDWSRLPKDSKEFLEQNRYSLFLPKTFLTQTQIAELQSLCQASNSEISDGVIPDLQKAYLEIRTMALKKNGPKISSLVLTAPEVNTKFVGDLRKIPGFKLNKSAGQFIFPADEETFMNVYSRLLNWKMLVKLDESCEALAAEAQRKITSSKKSMSSLDVSSIDEIKYADIKPDEWEWGTSSVPWKHQAQGIMFAATVMGIEVKRKGSD